jgi:hypothetical protein
MNAFDILMVTAIGSLIGTGIGLTIGSVAKKWGSTTTGSCSDFTLNSVLIVACSCISIAGLASVFLA